MTEPNQAGLSALLDDIERLPDHVSGLRDLQQSKNAACVATIYNALPALLSAARRAEKAEAEAAGLRARVAAFDDDGASCEDCFETAGESHPTEQCPAHCSCSYCVSKRRIAELETIEATLRSRVAQLEALRIPCDVCGREWCGGCTVAKGSIERGHSLTVGELAKEKTT